MSNVTFSKYFHKGSPYKAENWHALSLEQYFSKCFLDIYQCVFKVNVLTAWKLNNEWLESWAPNESRTVHGYVEDSYCKVSAETSVH